MNRSIFSLLLIFLSITALKAEAVKFSASAPQSVILDRPFQLVYTINTDASDLRVPDFEGFDVLAGPYESRSSSMQYINGRTTSSESVQFTYTLMAQKAGTFRLPAAVIFAGGRKYSSNGLSIKVLPAESGGKGGRGQSGSTEGTASVSDKNVFIRATLSKSSVYEQEAILLTYKLYTVLNVDKCSGRKLPDFNGFLKQEIELPRDKQLAYESFNGKNYGTAVLYQVLLYPQRSGVIDIPATIFDATIMVQNRPQVRSIFDDFFDSNTLVSKKLVAPAVRLTVKPLPSAKPSTFTGSVGHFSINSGLSTNVIETNQAVTLKVTIAGQGNLKLIKNPDVKFPDDFEAYDPKVTNDLKTSTSGVSGSKTIEYMFIPRHSGDFVIAPIQFSYFDIQTNSYKTLSTPEYKLHVTKGEGGDGSPIVSAYVNKEELKQVGKDIRYIYTGPIKLEKNDEPLFGSLLSWLMFLIPLLISLILFILFRKQVIDNADINRVRNKMANKVARKRLTLAAKLLAQGEKDRFYEEVLKAVWTYLSDKLSIPVASLTKEGVQHELAEKGVDTALIKQFVEILNTCEFARYAPGSGQQEMGNLYEISLQAISKLEEVSK